MLSTRSSPGGILSESLHPPLLVRKILSDLGLAEVILVVFTIGGDNPIGLYDLPRHLLAGFYGPTGPIRMPMPEKPPVIALYLPPGRPFGKLQKGSRPGDFVVKPCHRRILPLVKGREGARKIRLGANPVRLRR